MKDIGILAFTERGRSLAEKIAESLPPPVRAEIYDKEKERAGDFLKERFFQKDTFLFICAAGITVRLIAPLLRSKDVDPAVVVMDELGNHVIPILSGHLGGANEAARELSRLTGASVVLTTATDINEKFAVDIWSKKAGVRILEINRIKDISSAVLRGEKVGISSMFPISGQLPSELTCEPAENGICVSLSGEENPFPNTLHTAPRIVTIGAGCRKGVSPEVFEAFILKQLAENHIAMEAVEQLASVDLKKDEPCIRAFCEKYGIPFVVYRAEELAALEGEFTPSDLVKSVTGVDNVCERSAVLGSKNGTKILSKTSGSGCTCALAMRDWECVF